MISIACDGRELGAWSAVEVERLLQNGMLKSTDYFWQPDMPEWGTLDQFIPIQSVMKTYLVAFANKRSTDNFGFVRAGKVTLAHDTIVFAGVRPWAAWMRSLLFVILTPVLWLTFFLLVGVLPQGGQTFATVRILFELCAFLGTLFAILLLIDRFCVRSSSVSLNSHGISGVRRTGCLLSFVVPEKSGVSKKVRFVASIKLMAQELEDATKRVSPSNSVRADGLALTSDPEQRATPGEGSLTDSSESMR